MIPEDIAILDRVLKRTRTEPFPAWTALFVAALLGVFLAWMGLVAIEKAAFDAVNMIEVEQ